MRCKNDVCRWFPVQMSVMDIQYLPRKCVECRHFIRDLDNYEANTEEAEGEKMFEQLMLRIFGK